MYVTIQSYPKLSLSSSIFIFTSLSLSLSLLPKGKAAVRAEKASNPSLFSKQKTVVDRSKLSSTLSSEGATALAAFKVSTH